MLSDQNASLGGRPPAGKCMMSSCAPESVRPAPSAFAHQYIASCGTFTGPGKYWACAARSSMPLPGTPIQTNQYIQTLGDIKLEFNTELRQDVYKFIHAGLFFD